jgi:hypothetical protein
MAANSHNLPASSWHSTPWGDGNATLPHTNGEGNGEAETGFTGNRRNVDQHAVADRIGAGVAVNQVSVLEYGVCSSVGRRGTAGAIPTGMVAGQ